MKKIPIILLSFILIIASIVCINRYNNTGYLPVLGYHSVVSDEIKKTQYKDDRYTISETTFKSHITYLKENNFNTITMDELLDYYFNDKTLPTKSVLLTFDDGHSDLYDVIDPILKDFDYNGCAFIIGSKLDTVKTTGNFDYITTEQMLETTQLEYYSHTYNMHKYDNDKKILETASIDEIILDHKKMNNIVNNDIVAYPYGVSSNNAIEAYKQSDVLLAFDYNNFSNIKQTSDQYNLPRYMIVDITPLWYIKWIVG